MAEPFENRAIRRENAGPYELDQRALNYFPIAMSYVPWQRAEKLYNEKTALIRGTAYPSLDLPFCASEVR